MKLSVRISKMVVQPSLRAVGACWAEALRILHTLTPLGYRFIHVCMHACMYVYMYIYVYADTCTHNMYTCLHMLLFEGRFAPRFPCFKIVKGASCIAEP